MSTTAPLQTHAAKSQPLSSSAHAGLLLQRKCACGSPTASLTGECAECTSKKRLQTKLTIGASNDPLEQEADRVADQVLAAPKHTAVSGAPPRIQRVAGQANGQEDTAPVSVDRVLASSGRPLEPKLRQDMEQRFRYDFSRVRLHSGGEAEQSAREVNANAYTVGHDVVFGAGRFAPETHEGRRLIAHELTHVVQQSGTEGICAHGSASWPSISPTLLQKQDADKSDDRRFLRSMEAKEIAKDCPDFDDVVLSWIFQKAEPFIQEFYQGLNSVVMITTQKTWKTPSEWGELDVDINFSKKSQGASLEEMLTPDEGSQQHVKLTARFTKFADGLHVVGELIDWLDGHAIVLRNWEGVVKTDRAWALLGSTCNQTKIRDLSEPEPPRRFQKTKEKKRIQTKLTMGASNDPLEQEADRVADQVMARPAHSSVSIVPPRIQRLSGHASSEADAAPASVDRALASSGRPMEPALQQDMEQRFGHDFSRVRVHSGEDAKQSAGEIHANAYTAGHSIVFGAGRFAPGTHEGRRLIAHELTHVVQQSGVNGNVFGQSNDSRGLSHIFRAPISPASDAELQSFKENPPPPIRHFRPSTGVGDFNIRYDPKNNALIIDVQCYFNFVPGNQPFFILRSGKAIRADKYTFSEADPPLKTEQREVGWTPQEEAVWKNAFFQAVQSKWSRRFRFYCTKPGWEELKPTAIVTFAEAPHAPGVVPDLQTLNSRITVEKGATRASVRSRVKPFGNTASLSEEDVDDSTAAHEAGHMLGLGDEYAQAGEAPEAAHSALVEAEFGSKVIRGQQGGKESIMVAGDQVLPEHGVTMLEALKAISKIDKWSHISPKVGYGQDLERRTK